ncbi:MAG TPA: hypothetical protein PKC58_16200 [Ignavibacteria bacterium]|nr:hypothetical protein [Ignavibacteria bacterium]
MNNKAIEILKTFSAEEVKRFDDFLCSPFYNKSKKLISFYRILMKYYPSFDSAKLDEKSLSAKVSPDLEFNKMTINRLFFDLHHCAEEFLMILNFRESYYESQDYLRDEFFKRRLYKFVDDNIKQVKSRLDTNADICAEYYINMFHLHTDIKNLKKITVPHSNEYNLKSQLDSLSERAKNISYLFATEMVRTYENFLTFDKAYNIKKESEFLNSVFEKINFEDLLKLLIDNSGGTRNESYLICFLRMLNAFSNIENDKFYSEYKNTLILNMKDLSVYDKRFHTGRLIRYCMIRREKGDQYSKYNFELFNVYEYILNNEIYKTGIMQDFPPEFFRSIIFHSLRLKKYKWTIEFIKKYTKQLKPSRKKNMYHYSMALYYFFRKMYKDSLSNLNKIIFDDFFYKLDYRNMMLIIYFEMEQYESALSLIDSYNHFLAKDSTLSLSIRKRQKRFINLMNNLVQFKTTSKKTSSYYFDRTVDSELPFADWIRDKYISLNILPKKAV